MADANAITVGHTVKLNIVVFNGEPVLTFNMIDQAHGRQEGTAGHRFRENKQRFVEGEDYHRVGYGDAAALEAYGVNVPPRGLTLITETGYLLLTKSFNDDLAWQVQRQLVKHYFEGKPQRPALEPISAKQLQQVRDQMSNVTRYLKHSHQSLAQNLYLRMKDEFGYDKIENMPAKDLHHVLTWLAHYETIAHQVYDVTATIEKGFVDAVKQRQQPSEVYRDVLASLQAPLRLAIAA